MITRHVSALFRTIRPGTFPEQFKVSVYTGPRADRNSRTLTRISHHLRISQSLITSVRTCQPCVPSLMKIQQTGYLHTTQTASFFSDSDPSKIPRDDPEKGRLVYVGTLSSMVKLVKAFSVSTSIIGLAFQPFLFAKWQAHPILIKALIGGTLSIFIFTTPILLHLITKRYVTRLYWDSARGVYTATTYTFFVNEKQTTFSHSDLTFPEVRGLFTTIKVKGKPLFVDPSLFLDKEAYIRMMGYDKPLDWQLPLDEDENQSKKEKKS